ncbi:MAG: Gfo/Idh/MocA family protein, partial [Planctomycetia bacterium]
MLSRVARPLWLAALLPAWIAILSMGSLAAEPAPPVLKIGMIGLDTSHCLEFTKLINADPPDPQLAGCRVVAVHPKGSPDIASSVSRVPEYMVKIKAMGVEVVDDLPAMLARVDVVLLETNDGRPHLAQATAVIEAGKPLFIDKPVAGSLADAIVIYRLAEERGVPVFCSSALRFGKAAQAVRGGSIGDVTGCDAWSPCEIEPTHPDLFWYGIHGCELLFTAMGPGVKTVTRTKTADFEFVTGVWADGRIGTFRGIRRGAGGYGGIAFGTKGTASLGGLHEGVEIECLRRIDRRGAGAEEFHDLYHERLVAL